MTGESILTLVPEHVAGAFLLHAAGEVDISNANELARAIVESSAAVVVLDLGAVVHGRPERVAPSPGRASAPPL
jgi:anti-anti-sigma regulatory factor